MPLFTHWLYLSGVNIYFKTGLVPGAPWAILVVAPIMKRAQGVRNSREIVFLDSTASVDATSSNLTAVLTATGGGAIPLGVIIHESQSMMGHEAGFSLLKESCPKCFGGKSVS